VVPQIQNKNPGNIMNVRGKSPIATQHGLMEKGTVLLPSSAHLDLIPT